ncbi:MAG: alkaline phosphatase family protein [Desulfurococcaceae archaeon]|nr:alkaline phosphatase family protein [Desulfurococcaceae archaeon]
MSAPWLNRVLVLALVALLLVPAVLYTGRSSVGESGRLRVVLISIDAARFDHLVELAKRGELPNIAKLLEGGLYAEMVVVFPTATAVSHAAISTGAPPGLNGITGNAIHLPGRKITDTVSGFNGSYLLAEPIWVAADRQGLKTIVVSFPQSTPPAWNVTNSILFNIYDASVRDLTYSTLYTTSIKGATLIEFTDAAGWLNVDVVLGNVTAALESSIKICDTVWYLYLADLEGDGVYDKLVIAPEKNLSRAYAILSEGEWSRPINTTVSCKGKVYTVAPLFKAIKLDPEDFRLYRGLTRPFETPWFNNRDAAWSVWNNVIVYTGTFTDGDYYALTRGWIDVETYMETVNFTNKLFAEWTVYMIKNYEWDLLLSYTPVIDNVYHQFLGLTDPSMPYYNNETAEYYWGLIVRTYKMVDEFVGRVLESVPENTVVVLISDHGQVPVKKVVYINGILYNNGYVRVSGRQVLVNETKAYAPWHVHIFINLQGREVNGTVTQEEYNALVNEIVQLLKNYRDPETNEIVFDVVLTREEAALIGLTGERVGDIVYALRPGYTSSTAIIIRDGRAVEIDSVKPLVTVTGDHGPHLPHYRELRGIFVAYGPGVSGGYLGVVSSLQVAPTIAALLGIKPPEKATCAPVFTIREVTATVRETITETTTTITTETVTETTTETITERTTETTTLVETSPTTVVEVRAEYGPLAAGVVVALVLGFAAGYFAKARDLITALVRAVSKPSKPSRPPARRK